MGGGQHAHLCCDPQTFTACKVQSFAASCRCANRENMLGTDTLSIPKQQGAFVTAHCLGRLAIFAARPECFCMLFFTLRIAELYGFGLFTVRKSQCLTTTRASANCPHAHCEKSKTDYTQHTLSSFICFLCCCLAVRWPRFAGFCFLQT